MASIRARRILGHWARAEDLHYPSCNWRYRLTLKTHSVSKIVCATSSHAIASAAYGGRRGRYHGAAFKASVTAFGLRAITVR
jgi:hypothetical protein